MILGLEDDTYFAILAAASSLLYTWEVLKSDKDSEKYIDSLTNCYNRHYFRYIEELEYSGEKFYVAFADVDHFKSINDNYGHDVGDIVLKEISNILKKGVKFKYDFVLRWGGEEFILFFRKKNESFDSKLLMKRLEDIRKHIENHEIEVPESKEIIKVTASFGFCTDTKKEITERIRNADLALYYSKENGRNKITKYNKEDCTK